MKRNLRSVEIFFNFSQPTSPSKSIFQPIWAIFRGHHTLHGMHWTQMHSTIQHPNMYSSTIMQHNQRNTPVIIHPNNVFILQHLKMIPTIIQPCSTKILFVSLCHIKFHKLGIYPEQITCSITNHPNITPEYHSNLPTHVPGPPLKKSHLFTFFIFNPMAAQVKIPKCLILMYAHHLPPMSF